MDGCASVAMAFSKLDTALPSPHLLLCHVTHTPAFKGRGLGAHGEAIEEDVFVPGSCGTFAQGTQPPALRKPDILGRPRGSPPARPMPEPFGSGSLRST